MAGLEQTEEASVEQGSSIIGAILDNAYLGGELQAAFRQGANELGAALKAFPDAIQIDEPGAAFNPLYRDLAGDAPAHAAESGMEAAVTPLPSPIEIAQQSQGSVHGDPQASQEIVQSPSEIAMDPQANAPQQDYGQEHEQDHSHGR